MLVETIRHRFLDILYPGLDLHTRNRASLRRFWQTGPRDVLDAGSGNGYFSWLAYQTGARVVAMNYEQDQVRESKRLSDRAQAGGPVTLAVRTTQSLRSDP